MSKETPKKVPAPVLAAIGSASRGTMVAMLSMIAAAAVFWRNIPLFEYVIEVNGQSSVVGGGGPATQAASGVLYLIPAILGAFGLVVAIKRNPKRWIKVVLSVPVGLSGLFVMYALYSWWLPEWVVLGIFGPLGIFYFGYAFTGQGPSILAAPFLFWLASGIAVSMVIILPFYAVLGLLVTASVWDVYAVLRGPLKAVAKPSETVNSTRQFILRAFLLDFGRGFMGLGDMIFYGVTVLLAIDVSSSGLGPSITFLSIAAGTFVTYYILRRGTRYALPGLPIPVLLGLLSIGVTHLIGI